MSWEYSASAETSTAGSSGTVQAGGSSDALSLPRSGLSSALSLDGQVNAAMDSFWQQCCDQIARCMRQLQDVLAQLGVGAAGADPGTTQAGGPANSVPGAQAPSVPGASATSVPGAPGDPDSPVPPPDPSTPAGGPTPGPQREGDRKPDDGSKFLNIAQGVATILGGVGNMVGTIRNSGGLFGRGGLFGGGGGLFGGLFGGGGGLFGSPLTFDLNGNGQVGTTDIAGGRRFDLTGDGKVENTAWAEKGDGVLVFDADGDGVSGTSGRELLGNFSDVDGDGRADGHANGFEALKGLAKRHLGVEAVADGKLDASELDRLEQVAGLKMQVDGKNASLRDLGITEIWTGYTEAGANVDARGNQHRQVGAGFVRNGQVGKVDDVWFRYE